MSRDHSAISGIPWPILCLGVVAPLAVASVCWISATSSPDAGLRTAAFCRAALNLWFGGTLSRDGHVSAVFDPDAFAAALRAMFGSNLGQRTWSYPPPMLFPAVALSILPAGTSSVAWGLSSLAMLWVASRASGIGRAPAALALASPAALECLLDGQNGLACAALLLPGLMLLDKRPWLAGCLLGCLLVKPQMAVLVPVCIMASRNWRALAGASLGASALFIASLEAFGWGSWVGFARGVMPFMRHDILEAAWHSHTYQAMMATPFAWSRWAGASTSVAYAVQVSCSAAAVLATWRCWKDGDIDHGRRVTLTLALGALATPYGYCYDLPALTVALSAHMSRHSVEGPVGRILLAGAWVMPGTGTLLMMAGLPPLGVVGPLAAVMLVAHLPARSRACSREVAAHAAP